MQRVAKLFQYTFCPWPVPLFRFTLSPQEPIAVLRELSLRPLPGKPVSFLRKCANLLQTIFWPIRLAVMIATHTFRCGVYVRERYRIKIARQVWGQIYLGITENLNPEKFYKLRLFLPERRRNAHQYLLTHEAVSLLHRLNLNIDVDETRDKMCFLKICERAGLPTIPVVAVFEPNKPIQWVGAESRIPKRAIFLKERTGSNSRGAEVWDYDPDRGTWRNESRELNEAALLNHAYSKAVKASYLLQEKVNNGPDFKRFSMGGLVTVRIVTLRENETRVAPLFSFLKMPRGHSVTDAPSTGGIFSEVHVSDGTLGQATASDLLLGTFDFHPDTGARITGEKLESWPQLLELAVRAHHHFSFAAIGWDLTITSEGPLLVEGNSNWGAEVIQTASARPFGPEKFATWYLRQIETLFDGRRA